MEEKVRGLKMVVLLRILNFRKNEENVMKSERMKTIAYLCLRLGRSKAVRNGGIVPMCLIPL